MTVHALDVTAETHRIVRGYHDAWSERKDLKLAGSFLAANLEFRGSLSSFDSAAALLDSLRGLLPVINRVTMIDEFYAANRALLLYDLDTATPAGTMRIAEHFIIADGEIKTMKLVFDASNMR